MSERHPRAPRPIASPARQYRSPAGRAIVVVAASGAGKDTLLSGVAARRPDLHFARRVITRPATATTGAKGSLDEDFESVTEAEFERRRRAGGFAVTWRAHGHRYALTSDVQARVLAGDTVIFNGSRDALPEIRRVFADLAVILITVPAHLLRDRLEQRGREDPRQIEARLARGHLPPPEGAIEVANDEDIPTGIARLLAVIDDLTDGPPPD